MRKEAIRGFEAAYGRQELIDDRMYHLFARGKQGFDACMKDLGRMMAETIMYIEREEIAGPEGFSEELLGKVLRGLSCRKYAETVVEAAQAFGVSASSVSRHIIAATAKQLQEF